MVNIGNSSRKNSKSKDGRQAGLPKSFTATALQYTEH